MEDFDLVVRRIQFELSVENEGRILEIEKINNETMKAVCLAFIFGGWTDHLIGYLSMKGIIK